MVNKTSLLIKSNLRKSKNKIVVIVLLFILVATLLNTIFILETDYEDNFYRYKDELNATDAEIIFTDVLGITSVDDINNTIDKCENIASYEVSEVLAYSGETDFGDGNLVGIISLISYKNVEEKQLNQFEIVDEDPSIESGAYIGYLYKSSQGYKTGDTIGLNIGGQKVSFTIKGFYNNISTGTMNCMDITFILTDDLYEKYIIENQKTYKIGLNVNKDYDSIDGCNEIIEIITKNYPTVVLVESATCDELIDSRYTNAALFKAILLIAAIIITLILLIIITIILSNYIKSNTVNFGALKALGYTSSSLIVPIIVEFAVLALISSIVGIAGSYLLFPIINKALEGQVGIPYDIHIILEPGLISIGISLVVTVLTVYLSILKIKTIEPINAIRNTKKQSVGQKLNNVFPLEKTKLNLNTALGMKTCISGVARNIIISICYITVAFLIGFSCFIYSNVLLDTSSIIELVCGQVPNTSIVTTIENEQSVIDVLKDNPSVESFYNYTREPITPEGSRMIFAYVIDDIDSLNSDTVLLEGKFPETKDEIAINKLYCKNNDIKLGDDLLVKGTDSNISFKVVGYTQGAYYTGKDCYLQVDGYNRISPLAKHQINVNLKEGVDTDEFNESIGEKLDVISIANEGKYYQSIAGTYESILRILAIVIIALSILVSSFVLYILISLLLESKRREHGILKSLGFVTKDIIYQIVLSVIPFSMIASIVGLMLSKNLSSVLVSSLLNYIGIFHFGSVIGMPYIILSFAGIIIFTLAFTIIQSLSIKRITPHELFNRE